MDQKPSRKELVFLSTSYDSFLDIYEEISTNSFWKKVPYYRLSRMRDAVLIYSEILEYEPIGWFVDALKKIRPPLEAELSREYILFVRNILVHFPFFKSWDEITLTRQLINWSKPGKSIDTFLSRFSGQKEIKYRLWRERSKTMLYLTISFPAEYNDDSVIKLNQFMSEKEGFLFIISLMYRVLMSQVEDIK